MSSPKAELIASIDCNILAFLIILLEGYVRIPWNGKNEPLVSVPAKCSVCSRETKDGIAVKHEDAMLGFCTNRHYVQWWKTIHEDKYLRAENYQSPEERFKDE